MIKMFLREDNAVLRRTVIVKQCGNRPGSSSYKLAYWQLYYILYLNIYYLLCCVVMCLGE